MPTRLHALLLALPLAFVACKSEPWVPPDQSDLATTFTDCSGGQSCVIVELGCCDHCNGGRAVAVVAGQEDAVLAEHGESCGNNVACTEMGCAPLTATCEDNVCVQVQGSF